MQHEGVPGTIGSGTPHARAQSRFPQPVQQWPWQEKRHPLLVLGSPSALELEQGPVLKLLPVRTRRGCWGGCARCMLPRTGWVHARRARMRRGTVSGRAVPLAQPAPSLEPPLVRLPRLLLEPAVIRRGASLGPMKAAAADGGARASRCKTESKHAHTSTLHRVLCTPTDLYAFVTTWTQRPH